MRSRFKFLLLFVCIAIVVACEKKDTAFEDFLNNHEVVYPGVVSNISSNPGNLRVQLKWNPSTDQTVKRYVIYWNNGADSLLVNAATNKPSDTVKVIIPGLKEYVYSFIVYSYDDKGNRSIKLEANNVKVYGNIYQSKLLNRALNPSLPYEIQGNGDVKLNFGIVDTINITTTVKYTDLTGALVEAQLPPNESSVIIKNYKAKSAITYISSFKPVKNSIDTFYVKEASVFPSILDNVQCDKSLFGELHLPFDAGRFGNETPLSHLWDGIQMVDYPQVWHSDNIGMPHQLSFDMGRTYNNLSQIECVGRNLQNSINWVKFEVWGTNNLSDASPTVGPRDAAWTDQMLNHGWTLLKTVERSDNGIAPFKTNLDPNPPAVRYIRIRVLAVNTGSQNSSNMSELTFWNKE